MASSSGAPLGAAGQPLVDRASSPASPRPVWGDFVAHDHCSVKNIVNGLLCLLVLVPSFVATGLAYSRCPVAPYANGTILWDGSFEELSCSIAIGQPIVFVNVLFFINVSFLFWIIGLIQVRLVEIFEFHNGWLVLLLLLFLF